MEHLALLEPAAVRGDNRGYVRNPTAQKANVRAAPCTAEKTDIGGGGRVPSLRTGVPALLACSPPQLRDSTVPKRLLRSIDEARSHGHWSHRTPPSEVLVK